MNDVNLLLIPTATSPHYSLTQGVQLSDGKGSL